jgi:hypothetical protein
MYTPNPKRIAATFLVSAFTFAIAAHASSKPDNDRNRHLYSERLNIARVAYFKVLTSNDQATSKQAHQALCELEQAFPNDPVAKAYQGSLQLLDVAHSWAIWNLHKQATDGLAKLDEAVAEAPDEPEAHFIRAATSWHLPGFYHRKAQSEADFALLASRAQRDAREGRLPPQLAAAAFSYWGQILVSRNDKLGARTAFESAMRISATSPAGQEAATRLKSLP